MTAICETCGAACYPSWRLCAKCDPLGYSKKPVVGIVSRSEIEAHPTRRLDPGYWLRRRGVATRW